MDNFGKNENTLFYNFIQDLSKRTENCNEFSNKILKFIESEEFFAEKMKFMIDTNQLKWAFLWLHLSSCGWTFKKG